MRSYGPNLIRYRRSVCCFTGLLLFALVAVSSAHFNLNVNIRIIHVKRDANTATVMVRLPMAYLVADKLGPEQSDGSRTPAPYTRNVIEQQQMMHYLDADALRKDPEGLGRLVSAGHVLTVDGVRAEPEFVSLRAFPALKQSAFATWAEAESSFKGPVYDPEFEQTYAGDTVVDAKLLYSLPSSGGKMYLHSTLNPGVAEQDQTANLIVVTSADRSSISRLRGLLESPVALTPSSVKSLFSFVKSGVVHILEGTDHVLFVLCLVLGASTIPLLFWRVTGFTIGHSITLALGFFGYVPKADWFVPLVEAGIAASIIVAAWLALASVQEKFPMAMTASMGLLHGLGFSFVLTETLKMDSPDIWSSLLAFNVGVEVGQLLIVIVFWPVLLFLYRKLPWGEKPVQFAVAIPCIALASLWVGQRLTMFASVLTDVN